MPRRPMRKCAEHNCRTLVEGSGRCAGHMIAHDGETERRRGSAHSRGYDRRWNVERKQFLLDNPFCAICAQSNKETPATEVDHIIPHRGDYDLFWDKTNW